MKIDKNIINQWATLCEDCGQTSTEGDILEEELICEMANFLRSRHPELPSNIWISVRNASHGPRIKIQRNKGMVMQINDTFSMTISDSPEIVGSSGSHLSAQDIAYFRDFVIKNKPTLLAYWEGDLDTSDLTEKLVW